MTELLKAAGGNAALVAFGAIALANVIIWFAGGRWTPQKRAYVGIAAVLIVIGVWYWADASAFPSTRPGIVSVIVASLVLVLAAAGAPVYKETFFSPKAEEPETIDVTDQAGITRTVEVVPPPAEKPARTWGVWSR